jgi:hypothetical protein
MCTLHAMEESEGSRDKFEALFTSVIYGGVLSDSRFGRTTRGGEFPHDRTARWHQRWSGRGDDEETLLLPGIEPRQSTP